MPWVVWPCSVKYDARRHVPTIAIPARRMARPIARPPIMVNIRQSVHARPSERAHLAKKPRDWRQTRHSDMAFSLPRKGMELEMLTQHAERIHPIGRTQALRTI